ncbi:hypothetical protein [Actinopolymorpha rutila]|uniref:Uncharacterized protein n=1 Tax=Actinopolymorpha rutila TaxID=446787 RepID=A0A852ZTD8_9ACTN|nr:hypothetical protein [Actinopolymorpha rutila]NYH92260.1 hypothetical protein [Actinopolymorpha rutila]
MTDARLPTARELAGYFLAAQHPTTRRWVDDAVRLELLTESCALSPRRPRWSTPRMPSRPTTT